MPKPLSAGLLLYRDVNGVREVLLVHPSGAYNKKSPWSIPKGLADDGEAPEAAARRETLEETGVVAGTLTPLGSIDYRKSRKTVTAFGGEAPRDAAPHTASWEVDRAEFVEVGAARSLLHEDQRPFLDRLEALLAEK